VRFPADFLIWGENDFVNDLLKLRIGYPLYTAQQNNESQVYMPGAQLLTYLLAAVLRGLTSLPLLRAIQVGYCAVAAGIGLLCVLKLLEIDASLTRLRAPRLWGALLLPTLFLMATNGLTNPFVDKLHNDSLAQLISLVAFWLLLLYAGSRDRRVLGIMAMLPAAGFLVKQNLAIWAVFYGAYLALFDRPRSLRRLALFALVASGSLGLMLAGTYRLWGKDLIYWVFVVLAKRQVVLLRSLQHILDAWAYLAVGLAGGCLLLRGKTYHRLLGLWLIWLSLFAVEAYTSGIAWTLSHLGPGSLLAGVWFLAGVTKLGISVQPVATDGRSFDFWLRACIIVSLAALAFFGLGLVNIPVSPLPDDAYRYVADIEREFQGQPAEDVLLDVGSWLYSRTGVIMKDRATAIGDRGYEGIGDFSAFLQRLQDRRYAKILVRHLHSPDFWYDHYSWPASSGIRQTLLDSYREVRTIKAVESLTENYLFGEISVLVPK